LTEAEAKALKKKETDYCYVLECAWLGEEQNSICLERIFTKGRCEEIRMAWWKDGNQVNRPADIDAVDWIPLFSKAVEQGVFTDSEKLGMLKALLA
jgi:hypothetical protein